MSDANAPRTPPRRSRYREITVASVVFGLIFGAILNMAITYSGLKIGFTIVGSAIVAVVGFGVLRGALRALGRKNAGSIVEVNIGQTIGSAVNVPNSGVIFTVPVLLLMGIPLTTASGGPNTTFWMFALACSAGAVLGCCFIIPLRKQMIDVDRLRFPSAIAVGTILRSPGAGLSKTVALLVGIGLAALLTLPTQLPSIRLPADVDSLPRLVERGKVTAAQAETTRTLASWIEQRSAPAEVLAAGKVAAELASLDGATDLDADAKQARKDELRESLQAALPAGVSEGAALAAHRATSGEAPWTALRSKATGWAMEPRFGYADLGVRMPEERDEATGALTLRVDRDRDGKPDLLVQNDRVDVGRALGLPDEMELVFAIAPFALGAGFLTGRAGLYVLAGGVLAYLVLNPVAYQMGWLPETTRAHQAAGEAFASVNRPLGIGLLLGGALMGIIASLPGIKAALKSIGAAGAGGTSRDELGLKFLGVAILAGLAVLYFCASTIEHQPGGGGLLSGLPPALKYGIIAVVAAGWMWFAGIIIAQCTGMTDWSPLSGMALLTVVLVMLLAGTKDVTGAVLVGAALCVAIGVASDMMADLKTGYIVGSIPRRQQIVEIMASGLGPLISLGTLLVLVAANIEKTGIPIGPGTDTVAPQAQALQAVITGVQGGDMPYALYGLGAVVGALLGLGAFPGLGVLVGLSIYLPMLYIATYGIGCVINMVCVKVKGRRWTDDWGVPVAAGFIVGDALLALIVNFTVIAMG